MTKKKLFLILGTSILSISAVVGFGVHYSNQNSGSKHGNGVGVDTSDGKIVNKQPGEVQSLEPTKPIESKNKIENDTKSKPTSNLSTSNNIKQDEVAKDQPKVDDIDKNKTNSPKKVDQQPNSKSEPKEVVPLQGTQPNQPTEPIISSQKQNTKLTQEKPNKNPQIQQPELVQKVETLQEKLARIETLSDEDLDNLLKINDLSDEDVDKIDNEKLRRISEYSEQDKQAVDEKLKVLNTLWNTPSSEFLKDLDKNLITTPQQMAYFFKNLPDTLDPNIGANLATFYIHSQEKINPQLTSTPETRQKLLQELQEQLKKKYPQNTHINDYVKIISTGESGTLKSQ